MGLGVKDQVTFSNGVKLSYSVPVSEGLRRLYHFFSRAKPGMNGDKLFLKIKKEFQKENNVKRDITNKVARHVTNNYSRVVFQGDSMRSWGKPFGEKIYQISIGGIREALKRKASTPVEVGRFVKTTGVCPHCDYEVKLSLSDRGFTSSALL